MKKRRPPMDEWPPTCCKIRDVGVAGRTLKLVEKWKEGDRKRSRVPQAV